MIGDRPYKGTCRREVKQQVLSKQVFVTKKNLSKKKWSNDSADFINKCIQRKPCNRLGYIGINQLKEHPWLKYFNWKDLYVEKMKAPYIPDINEENFEAWDKNIREKLHAIFYLDITEDEMKKRLLRRNERDDDNENAIKERIRAFNYEMKPLINYLRKVN